MPVPATANEFLDLVRESGIVDEKRLEEFLEQWYAVSPMPEDPATLAEDLLKGGLITNFQKGQLVQGKFRGFVLAGKYVLLDHLGAGGMGSVFLCEHKVMRRRVAIKVLPPTFAKDPEYLARFHREARAVAALDHPNIVRAFDVDQDGPKHFLVMEYVEGSDLHDLVTKNGPLGIQQAADYISQAAAGLEAANDAGLVHRDIKPSNLLVDRKGVVKILDMGLALFFQERESLTKQYDASAVLGTADYLAPEQVIDSHGVDTRADIYSLGLTFFFLLTGQNPYGEGTVAQKLLWHQMRTPRSVREVRPDVPEGLAAIITKMIAKDRNDRYQTPGELVQVLAPYVWGTAEEGEQTAAAPDNGAVVSAPVKPSKEAETPTAVDSTAETAVDGDKKERKEKKDKKEEPTTAEKRPSKTSRADSPGASGARRRPGSGKLATAEDGGSKTEKSPRTLTKQRRPKALPPPSFWTRERLLAAVGGGALVLILIVLGVGWLLSRGSSTPTPTQRIQVQPPASQLAHTAQPATTPAPATQPKPPPPTQAVTAAIQKTEPVRTVTPPTNPATMPMLPTMPIKPLPAEVKKVVSLADYFPKPGTTLVYDAGNYARGGRTVVRQKWDFKKDDKGVIDVTTTKIGQLEGGSLLSDGQVQWNPREWQKKEKYFYRTSDTHYEIGQYVGGAAVGVWEPVLPLKGAEGDTWTWQMPNGAVKTYTLTKFDTYNGQPAVVIRDELPVPPDAAVVTTHVYVKGAGEVARVVNLEKKGAAPQLLGEEKLVEKRVGDQ